MLLKIGQRPDHGFDRPLGLLSDCHRRIEHFLGILVTIAREAHGAPVTDAQRSQLQAAVTYFAVAAPKHTADEEHSLFPRLRESRDEGAVRALHLVDRLEQEHHAAEGHHRVVDRLVTRWLSDGSLPDGEATELSLQLAMLRKIYEAHIALEDGVVFPVATRTLSDDQLRAIGREMAARRHTRDLPA
jgi:hemerythrin-like domain-containing protein